MTHTSKTAGWLALAGVLAAATGLVAGQQTRDAVVLPSAKGTGVISGTLVGADQSAAPIRRASVDLYGSDAGGGREVITDDNGRFVFANLPAGRYQLSAYKRGYADALYGAKRPADYGGATSIALADGQRMTGLVMKMAKGAIITGRVIDLNGQPAVRANVQVYKSQLDWRSGLRQFINEDGAEADDRGIYRIYGLTPGDYIVSASTTDDRLDFHLPTSNEWQWIDAQLRAPVGAAPSAAEPPAGQTMAYAPVFYPGTPVQANASVVTVGAAEERSGIDIHLDLVPTARIEGVLNGPDGIGMSSVLVRLLRGPEAGTGAFQVNTANTDAEGHFALPGVTPGTYLIAARAKATGAAPNVPATTWALSEITVAGHDQKITLDLQPGLPIGGRVVFDGGTSQPPPDFTRVRVNLLPQAVAGSVLGNPQMLSSNATVDAAGRITFTDVSPGRYRVTAFVGPGQTPWNVRSATIGGVDAIDAYVDIKAGDRVEMTVTFTDRPTELGGVFQDTIGRPAPDYYVIAFPADERLWMAQSRRIQTTRPASDGKYRFPNLAAGEYFVSAVSDVEQFQWYDPGYLAQLKSSAIRIAIAEGDKKVQDLKIKGG